MENTTENLAEMDGFPVYTRDGDALVRAELERIGKDEANDCLGLAFSGGGIRSASFGMGVMQALAYDDSLRHMDYLSSVSGGGYLSSSLTWYLSQRDSHNQALFNCESKFPFGKKYAGNKTDRNSLANNILNYIRQHGNYLIPGKGLGVLSFIATALRVVVGSYLIYASMITLVLIGLLKTLDWSKATFGYDLTFFLVFAGLALLGVAVFVLTALLFSIGTYFGVDAYRADVSVQRRLGTLLLLIFSSLALASLPFIADNLKVLVALVVNGASDQPLMINGTTAVSSSVLGAIMSYIAHRRTVASNKEVSSLQINLAAFLLLFGMLFGAFVVARELSPYLGLVAYLLLLGVAGIVALFCNVNLFGLNRMYRNRLMETFMQAVSQINNGIWAAATDANKAKVADMCAAPNNRPYHLINCNIVLVDSNQADFRGRKGDSFLFSPLYCGSDATGWRQTSRYSNRGLRSGITLPTAMAISGAAANPNAGVAGKGATTDKFVSMLMSLLNLRLGFWAENPKNESQFMPPNYLFPGLQGTSFFGKGLSETQRYVELSDGGHFENLGIYELLRRRVKLIMVSDAGQDEHFEFSDLANAVEKARVDFGIKIEFDEKYGLDKLMPGSDTQQDPATQQDYKTARRGFALATITYPQPDPVPPGYQPRTGYLVYIKPTLLANLGVDVISYRRQNASFPHQTTLDQFFDEVQFEAYRALGYSLGTQMLKDLAEANSDDEVLAGVARLLGYQVQHSA